MTQVSARRPRQAAIQNLPHRWITINAKNSSTLQRCTEFTKWPEGRGVPPAAPPTVRTRPGDEHHHEGRQRQHPEHVDPGGDVGGLPVRAAPGPAARTARADHGAATVQLPSG